MAKYDWLMLICGHYEGVDERIREHLVTDEISIGDYVLTGGELAAMVVTDAVVQVIAGSAGFGGIFAHMNLIPADYWNIPSIPDLKYFADGKYPRYCFREIMGRLPNGAVSSL